jgi:CxxC motif-containing protein (DUF1111 family)
MPRINKRLFKWVSGTVCALTLSFTIQAAMQNGPIDPGVRAGTAGAGDAISGLSAKEAKFFEVGQNAFSENQSVLGTVSGTEPGLGPRFNMDSCVGCHAQPVSGGSSPAINPQVAVATKLNATNKVPYFVTLNGPVREARFKYVDPPRNTIRDGGVHALFTIAGRQDASGCVSSDIPQPDFDSARSQNNISFRIPTPVFGTGLIEAIADETILANIKNPPVMGVSGHPNREGNAGTITRFGWKAQNKSLVIFAAEAYNVEQGVTNELFPQERDETSKCTFGTYPEDHTNFDEAQAQSVSSDAINFANFMRFLAPPTSVASYGNVTATSITQGATLFDTVGCTLCHTPSMKTDTSSTSALNSKTANLYSDLLVHHMGTGLADDITQGSAGPDEFRTAPLWGVGQRMFFLHDGRTSNLLDAIEAHDSRGSEASQVISKFEALSVSDRQAILNFLRSL